MASFNREVRRMLRNKRQAEGVKQEQPVFPPEAQHIVDMPLSFAYTYRGEGDPFATGGEQQQRTNLFIPPAFETNALEELGTSFKPDSELDPIPQSYFFAAGNKIRPWAHNRVANAGYLAMPEWLGGADDEFHYAVDKFYFPQLVGQQVGKQQPIDIFPLIPESEYTTYGATHELLPGQVAEFPVQDGYLYG